jgi:hypothetical protein
MKKIVASVGLVALGASGLQAQVAPSLASSSTAKPWNVSATLRGFYDDNVSTVADNAQLPPGTKEDSFGFEVSPAFSLGLDFEQTKIKFGAVYSIKYYDNQPLGNSDHYDQSVTLAGSLDHRFNERYSLSVRDSFVIGQEPDLLRSGNSFSSFQRISGDNIRNTGSVDFDAQLSRLFGVEVGYANTMTSYDDNHDNDKNIGMPNPASFTGLLDVLDHVVHVDGHWQAMPQTTVILGYQFRDTEYTGDEQIGQEPNTGAPIMSDQRNSRSHYVYVGADHTFRPDLTGSIRGGARYTEYYNDENGQDDWGPYALASLKYTYRPDSYLEAGFSYDYNTTDLFSVGNDGSITLNAQSASLYATLHHKITPKLFGTLNGQVQSSTYNGGAYDNETDYYFLFGANLEYRFNPFLSAELGYNYDRLKSDISTRDYDRNRVYIGVTANY